MEEGKVSRLELSSNDNKETTWRRERSRGWSYLLMTERRQHGGGKGLAAGAIF